ISLGLGIQRLAKKNVLVRRLPSVETLGSTTVICTDKTGTLTMNQMTVKKLYANREVVEVTGEGYSTKGKFSTDISNLDMLLKIGVLCNNANVEGGQAKGDPTEAALVVSAAKGGLVKSRLESKEPRLGEIPFSSESKMMVTYHKVHGRTYAYVKGAPDVILEKCSKVYINGMVRRLNRKEKEQITKAIEDFASSALRVLGFAFKDTKELVDGEHDLVFVGLQGMIDPPRPEVKESIKKCTTAGIKVVMITGDHQITATAIGRELGLQGKALTGKDLDNIRDLSKIVEDVSIYARVNPAHKLKIIEALKKKGHNVAMTGDGVNDAPALKAADIGIAMGIAGTDVSKEASDMILADDNFVSIVHAVEEGRGIYDNIKKFVGYLLSANIAEVLIIFLATLVGWPLPLIAVQLLWINLITDGLPALALGIDPPSKGIMKRPPRDPKEHILSRNIVIKMLFLGGIATAFVLAIFHRELAFGLIRAQTMAFTLLVLLELIIAYLIRANYSESLFSNKKLLLAVLSSFVLQMAVVYTPLSKFFETSPLLFVDWIYMISVCALLAAAGYLGDKLINRFTHHLD
ncbi:MAG: HAD-IC family P-type ATPase, partial [Candidatus Woesearchaeota archaeon]